MYSPDHADIYPRNPANYSTSAEHFIVAEYQAIQGSVKISDVLLKDFSDEEAAKAALLAIDTYKADELNVIRVQEDGDEMVMSCFEWDADLSKYVAA